MNLVVLLEDDFVGGSQKVRLTGRRQRHLLEIQRVEPGVELRVGCLNGQVGTGRVIRLGTDWVELEVSLSQPPPPPLPVTLVLALPRPPVLRRVLITATSMGVKEIVLLGARAVEKSFWQSHALAEPALFEQLLLGLEQGQDTMLPRVSLRPHFRPFVNQELAGLLSGVSGYIAHPEPVRRLPPPQAGPALIAVGPEAGWSDRELGLWETSGCRPISLGKRPLRVEAAVPALLSRML